MTEPLVTFELPRAADAPASPAAILFLRGRDADARIQALVAARAGVRPLLASLTLALVERRAFEPLGFRSLGDYGRERLGLGLKAMRVLGIALPQGPASEPGAEGGRVGREEKDR